MKDSSLNLGFLLNKATLLLKRELGKKLMEYEITSPQWSVLQDLSMQEELPEQERKVTPAAIAERILADRPTVSGIIDRLIKKGYLRARPNPRDRRSQLMELTPEARELLPTLQATADATLQQALKDLPSEMTGPLATSLITMIHNLEQEEHSK